MKNVFCIIVLISVLAFHNASAQLERTHIPPSPNAASMVKSAGVEVGHYTGFANISIPLGILPSGDISIPITLNYQTSGIKVEDVSSVVGLGWNLNVTSFSVTRVVRGLPDGQVNFCGIDQTSKVDRNNIWSSHWESCDSERDLYYFSFPGRNGKMFLDETGLPQTMPYEDLSISPGVGPASIGYWKIVDEAGYTYYFGESTSSQEQTTYFIGDHITNNYTQKSTFISTWYLNRIVSPTGIQVATFTYNVGNPVAYNRYGTRVLDCQSSNIPYKRVDLKMQINSPKYIGNIATNIATCVFVYDNNRSDLPGGLRLANITFKDDANAEKRRFHFEGDCFIQYPGFSINPCTRLKLSRILEGISNPIVTHTFLYNTTVALPGEDSYYTDHYGYFNLNGNDLNAGASNGLGYADLSVPSISGICNTGRLKITNGNYPLALILNEIQYAGGARTTFSYQVNKTPRISSISNYNNSTLISKSTFTYAGEESYRTPVYYYYDTESNPDLLIRSSNAYNSVFDMNGIVVGYGSVTETLLDGSKIVRTFSNYSDYPDESPVVGKYKYNGNVYYKGTSNVDSSPFAPYSSNAWMRGLPKSVEIKDNANNTVQKEVFNYVPGTVLSTVWNMTVEPYVTEAGNWHFYVGDYMLRSQPVTLESHISYSYDQGNPGSNTSLTTTYSYHNTYKNFPNSITTSLGTGGSTEKITFRYPIDVAGSGSEPTSPQQQAAGVWSLIASHIITPIERLQYHQEPGQSSQIVGGELNTYKKNTVKSKPLPLGRYILDLQNPISNLSTPATLTSSGTIFSFDNNRYRLVESYVYNNNTGNLTSSSGSNGIETNYEWGHNNSLITGTYNLLGSTQFKKQFDYNTIFGVTSKIDENNQLTTFQYNPFGQLKLVKDQDNNITTRYRYHNPGFDEWDVDFSPSQSNAGTITNFTCTSNNETVGVTTYSWDFGDGTTQQTSLPNTNHNYISAGVYLVKLTKSNAEYGTISISKTFVVL